MMKKILLGFAAAMMAAGGARAQDPHFTQYFASPLYLNPALTGLTNEDVRLAADFRTQWATVSSNPYITGVLSYDMAVLKGKLPEGDAMGIGLLGLYDKSGSGALQNTTVGLSVAYHKAFGVERQQHFSLGVQGALVQKSIDFTRLTFEDQYSSGGVLTGNATQQGLNKNEISYPDFNVGGMYSGRLAPHATGYIGASYYHLTQPVESFLDKGNHQIHSRTNAYLGGSFDMNDNTSLYASVLYQNQASSNEVVIGAAIGFILNPAHDVEYQKNTTLYLGSWYRYGDAISPYIGIEWAKMRIGVSYDVNVSSFTPATGGNGAYEISLQYFGKINKHEKSQTYNWACPKVF